MLNIKEVYADDPDKVTEFGERRNYIKGDLGYSFNYDTKCFMTLAIKPSIEVNPEQIFKRIVENQKETSNTFNYTSKRLLELELENERLRNAKKSKKERDLLVYDND
jgi:hypothetical protein